MQLPHVLCVSLEESESFGRQTLDSFGTEIFNMAPLLNQEVWTNKFYASALENLTLAKNTDITARVVPRRLGGTLCVFIWV